VPPNIPVTLEAAVFSNGVALPTGTVQFFSGSLPIGNPVKLQNSLAILTTSQLSKGSNTITAAYSGDANFNASASLARTLFIGNPDFQIAVNPGNVTASATTAGTATLLVSPGPGLGLAGAVSFTCSGLPAPATCAVQPAQMLLDGFTPATAKVTITKSAAQGAVTVAALRHQRILTGPVAALSIVFVFLLSWFRNRRYLPAYTLVLLCLLTGIAGCGGSSSSATPAAGSVISGTSTVVTVTASGGFGPDAVSHSVTLVVTFQ